MTGQEKPHISVVKDGLACCQLYADADGFFRRCGACPYNLSVGCIDVLHKDTLQLLETITKEGL